MNSYLDLAPRVARALARGEPVVALESTVIAHGLPHPLNLETAAAMQEAVRAAGAEPAVTGILDGRIRVGLDEDEVARFATAEDVRKVSRRDLAFVLASGEMGATTVAGTMICAALAGIRVFATGGIGGVHRGWQQALDVSADLVELGRTPVAVVCAGAKSILDLPNTLEYLETLGVPVVGFRTGDFPAFYGRSSGLELHFRVDDEAAAARLMRTTWEGGFGAGIVFANPIPADRAIPPDELEAMVQAAVSAAAAAGVAGKDLTPFLLDHMGGASGGRSLAANAALLTANAGLAGRIARAYAEGR